MTLGVQWLEIFVDPAMRELTGVNLDLFLFRMKIFNLKLIASVRVISQRQYSRGTSCTRPGPLMGLLSGTPYLSSYRYELR